MTATLSPERAASRAAATVLYGAFAAPDCETVSVCGAFGSGLSPRNRTATSQAIRTTPTTAPTPATISQVLRRPAGDAGGRGWRRLSEAEGGTSAAGSAGAGWVWLKSS